MSEPMQEKHRQTSDPAVGSTDLLGECTHDDVREMPGGLDPDSGNEVAGWIECRYCGKVLLP